jgi:hypothetical protein
MLGLVHVLPGSDFVGGAVVLSVLILGAVLAVLGVCGVVAFRRAGAAGPTGALWRGALVVVGAVLAWALLDRSSGREHAADRRAFDVRAAELTARAIAPGSPLACLDAVASGPVETGCEKALFASPESIAAAIAYVDARFSLLSAGIALAARDPSYEPALQRLRRAIEIDRYGLVAHVLATRGCNSPGCADLKLLRDPTRVLANMKTRSFDAQVAMHGASWHPPTSALAAIPTPPSGEHAPGLPDQTIGAASPVAALPAATPPNVPLSSRYDFPSSASIPAVSIMNAEPPLPAEPRVAAPPPPAPQPRPAAAPPQPRRQTSRDAPRESAPPHQPLSPPPHQPLSVMPEGAAAASGQTPTVR